MTGVFSELVLRLPAEARPTDAEVQSFIADVPARDDLSYPYVVGGLKATMRMIAEDHLRCRRHDCRTCLALRLAFAAIVATESLR